MPPSEPYAKITAVLHLPASFLHYNEPICGPSILSEVKSRVKLLILKAVWLMYSLCLGLGGL